MAMCRAVWPEDRANPVTLCHSQGDRTRCHQCCLRVLHSNSSLRAGWLAAEGFQQASKPSEIQHQSRQSPLPGTGSPSSHERIGTTTHMHGHAAVQSTTKQQNSFNNDRPLLFHFYTCFLYFPKQTTSSLGLLNRYHFCFTDQGGYNSRLKKMQHQNQD